MSGTNGKEWPLKLKERCENVGWTVTYTKSGHYKVQNHSGKQLFTFASTPNGGAYMERNAVAEARRHGLERLEQATERLRENERKLRIARDRADAEAKLAAISAAYHQTENEREREPMEPAHSETDAVPAPTAKVDPELNPGTRDKSRPNRMWRAPSRDLIDGSHVVTTQSTALPGGFSGSYETSTVLTALLEDGRTVYLCNARNAPTCTAWSFYGVSVRAHAKVHSDRSLALRAIHDAEEARRQLNHELNRQEKEKEKTQVSTSNPFGKAAAAAVTRADATSNTPAELVARIGGVMERMAESFASIITASAEVQRQFQQLRAELAKIEQLRFEPDPELVDKAAKYDQFKALMQ